MPRQASKNKPSQSLCVEGKAPTAEVPQPAPARGLWQEVRAGQGWESGATGDYQAGFAHKDPATWLAAR